VLAYLLSIKKKVKLPFHHSDNETTSLSVGSKSEYSTVRTNSLSVLVVGCCTSTVGRRRTKTKRECVYSTMPRKNMARQTGLSCCMCKTRETQAGRTTWYRYHTDCTLLYIQLIRCRTLFMVFKPHRGKEWLNI
jgi:hypothetical protein